MTQTVTEGWTKLSELLGARLERPETGGAIAHPTGADMVREVLAIASRSGLTVEIVGLGLRQGWGEPLARRDLVLDMRGLDRMLEYAPEDMVVMAEAGMTLLELNALLATHEQVLPLEVARPEATTLGGLVAAAPLSMSRSGYGEVRDWLLGLEVATPEGETVKGGGKVVKNVAGYDLCKLYGGSLGTLGAITSVTFKVRPRWADSRLVKAAIGLRAADPVLEAIQTTSLFPAIAAIELDSERMTLWLGFDGSEETVSWQEQEATRQLRETGGQIEALSGPEASLARERLRDLTQGSPEAALVARVSGLPSNLLEVWTRALDVSKNHGITVDGLGLVHHGTLWCSFKGELREQEWGSVAAMIRSELHGLEATATLERRPAASNIEAVPLDPVARKLMARIKSGLDPRGVLAPGRLRLEGNSHG